MRSPLSLSFLLGLSFLVLTSAHWVELDPGDKECFHETLEPHDKMTVTYEVGGASSGNQLDIDFYVSDSDGKTVHTNYKKSQGTFSLTAIKSGRYTYCFSNEMSSYSRKTLSFNVHGTLYFGDDEQIAPVEQEIRDLSSGLQLIKDEQSYLVVRERVHRDTCESTSCHASSTRPILLVELRFDLTDFINFVARRTHE